MHDYTLMAKAAKFFKLALSITEALLGPASSKVGEVLVLMSEHGRANARAPMADRQLTQALGIFSSALGACHPQTERAAEQLLDSYLGSRKFSRAAGLVAVLVPPREAVLGLHDIAALKPMDRLADELVQHNRRPAAVRLYQQAVATRLQAGDASLIAELEAKIDKISGRKRLPLRTASVTRTLDLREAPPLCVASRSEVQKEGSEEDYEEDFEDYDSEED